MYLPLYFTFIISLIAYTAVFFYMMTVFFEIRWNKRILFCCSAVGIILIVLSSPVHITSIKNLILLASYFFCLCLIFIKPPYNYFVFPFIFTEAYLFILVSFGGLIFGIISHVTSISLDRILLSAYYQPFGLTFALCSSTLFLVIILILPNFHTFSQLMIKTSRLSVYHLIGLWLLDVISLLASVLFYKLTNSVESCELYIVFQVTLIIVFILLHALILSATKIIEIDVQNEQMDQMLTEQIQQYRAYARYTSSIHDFQKKYKEMMGNVHDHFQKEDYISAKREIDQINEQMYALPVHKQYSNHLVIDAMLQSFANTCIDEKVPFQAKVYIPDAVHPHITDIDICTISHTILGHLQKHMAHPPKEAGISITSSYKNNWLSLRIQTLCEKQPDKIPEQNSIDAILEPLKGILSTDYDADTHTYDLILSLPGLNFH